MEKSRPEDETAYADIYLIETPAMAAGKQEQI